jgi:para-nitrobenzyl esterase
VFNNLGELPLFPDRSVPELAAASAPDRKVADQMSSYWVNFARTGDPNGRGLPSWPAHGSLERVDAAILDADPATEKLPSLDRMRVFDSLLERQLAN